MSKNITGQKFGRLTAIEPTKKRDGQGLIIWKFQCDCGKIVEKVGRNVWRGNTASCGCLKKDLLIQRNIINNSKKYAIGKKFGNLTIISDIFFKSSKRGKQQSWVKCKCNCGNIIEVATNNLGAGNTKSCGCISSFGEQKIIKILIDNNINFSTQYSFSDLIGPKGGRLKFDFAIFKDNTLYELIEFDGKQHFQETSGTWNHADSLKERQKRDTLKNDYCKKHNIKLICIPYTEINNIDLKMLNLENFLLKKEKENEIL